MYVTGIVLLITMDCNLDCPACYVKRSDETMGIDVARRAIDLLVRESGDIGELRVGFFGGEPTLNLGLVKEAIRHCEQASKESGKFFVFDITTNGTLLTDDAMEFLWSRGVAIRMSWDGDRQTILATKGEGAYRSMRQAIKALAAKGYRMHARTKFFLTGSDSGRPLISHVREIIDAGFEGYYLLPLYTQEAWDQDALERMLLELSDEYCRDMSALPDFLRRDILLKEDLLTEAGLKKKASTPCAAGGNLLSVAADGSVIPCQHPESWLPDMKLGDVSSGKLSKELRRPFEEIGQKDFPDCAGCGAAKSCSGPCYQLSFKEKKDIHIPCENLCSWVRARCKTASHLYKLLWEDKHNVQFAKFLVREACGWAPRPGENVYRAGELPDFTGFQGTMRISLALKEEDLNTRTGEALLKALGSAPDPARIGIVTPLPPCIFGAGTEDARDKYGIPLPLMAGASQGAWTSAAPNVGEAVESKITELFTFCKNNPDLPGKCRNCLKRIRGNCDYAYVCL